MKKLSETVIITGGSSGIGLAVAKAFVRRGANVVLNGRDTYKLQAAADALGATNRVATVAGDIRDKDTGQRLVNTAVDQFGRVDVLVNNAGIFQPKPFLDYTEDDVDNHIDGNLKGTFFTTQAAVRQMKSQGGGAIVNIGSVLTRHSMAGVPSSAPIASKGGIEALTISLATELGADGIRVNMVAPGVVRTPIYGDGDIDSFAGIALLNRVGEGDDIADAVVYLAHAEFATGVVLPVDGGFAAGRSDVDVATETKAVAA